MGKVEVRSFPACSLTGNKNRKGQYSASTGYASSLCHWSCKAAAENNASEAVAWVIFLRKGKVNGFDFPLSRRTTQGRIHVTDAA